MKKLILATAVVALAICANAGTFIVTVKMPDDSLRTFELAAVPVPDSNGLYKFHDKERGGSLIVHVSNVWIEEKSNKSKRK